MGRRIDFLLLVQNTKKVLRARTVIALVLCRNRDWKVADSILNRRGWENLFSSPGSEHIKGLKEYLFIRTKTLII